MARTNVIKIPMYNKGSLSCVGYREGCGYNVKVFWGDIELSSSRNLEEALKAAYCGVRAFHFWFEEWLTVDLRRVICSELEEAIFLAMGMPKIDSFTPLVQGMAASKPRGDGYYVLESKLENHGGICWGDRLSEDLVTVTLRCVNECSEKVKVSISQYASIFDYEEIHKKLLTYVKID